MAVWSGMSQTVLLLIQLGVLMGLWSAAGWVGGSASGIGGLLAGALAIAMQRLPHYAEG